MQQRARKSVALLLSGLIIAPVVTACTRVRAQTPVADEPAEPLKILSANEMLLRAHKQNPEGAALVPITMHMIARGLKRNGTAPETDLDRIFDELMRRNPGVSREVLEGMVEGYNQLPESTRNTVELPALRQATSTHPLRLSAIRSNMMTLSGTGSMVSMKHRYSALMTPGLLSSKIHLGDYAPEVKSIVVSGNYEQGTTLTISGSHFATDKTQNVFFFSEKVNNKFVKIGEMDPDQMSGDQAVITLPGKYNPSGAPVVPDTDPPVEYQVQVVRKAASNPFEKEDTESEESSFEVPHFIKDDVPAMVAGPQILSTSVHEVYAGEQVIDVKAANVGNVKVVSPGLHNNKPVLPDPIYQTPKLRAVAFPGFAKRHRCELWSDRWREVCNHQAIRLRWKSGAVARFSSLRRLPRRVYAPDWFVIGSAGSQRRW